MPRNFSKMSPTPYNISDAMSYITGQINPQYNPYNMPSVPDRITLSDDQILSNYTVLDRMENDMMTTFFSSKNTVDDIFAVAFSAGASNFLRANGFPDNYPYYINDLKDISTKLPYNVNIDFSAINFSPIDTPTYQPTQGPTYQPTQGPIYQPTQGPTQETEKDDILKHVYISLLLGCILFIVSIPFVYEKNSVVIGVDFLVCFLLSFSSVFLYYKLKKDN